MLPKFRSFVRPIIRSFIRSFIVRSSSLFIVYCSFIRLFTITVHHYYLSLLFIIVTIHRHYSPSLLFVIAIRRHYSLLLLFIVTIHRWHLWSLFVVTIHHFYSPLLFIDHPLNPNFNYSFVMLSSLPKTSQTNISVIRTLVTVIFLPVGTSHLVTPPRFLQVEHA
jgi:hypothetical protein